MAGEEMDEFDLPFDFADAFDSLDEETPLSEQIPEEALAGISVVEARPKTGAGDFAVAFILGTRVDYKQSGRGDWICVVQFPHNRVTDDVFRAWSEAARRAISRARAQSANTQKFYVVSLEYKIMPDNRRVVWSVSRMDEANYKAWRVGSHGGWLKPMLNRYATGVAHAASLLDEE